MNTINQQTSREEFLAFMATQSVKQDSSHVLAKAISEALIEGIDIDILSDDCEEGEVDAGILLEDGCTTFFMKHHTDMVTFAETLAADAGISDLNAYIHSSVDADVELELDGIATILKGNIKTMTDELREHLYYVAEWLISRKLMMVMSSYNQHRQACY